MHADAISPDPRALIVEDETLIAEELRERLSRLGFSVIATVGSGEEGVAIATRERPDLVLMDIRLKGAHSDRPTVDRAKKTDHDGFILKPFLRRELQTTIEVAMQRHARRVKQEKQ